MAAVVAFGVGLIAGVFALGVFYVETPKLPTEDALWTLNRQPAVQFVDTSGRTLAVRGHLYAPPVRSAGLPAYVGQAFIAAEDQRFLKHGGVDPQAVVRAIAANLLAGHTVQGGSTLTQQLVKNLLVGDQQSLKRKIQEARLATEMEGELSKNEILDLYLNRVYLGSNAYGVEAAAKAYFGKPAAELSLGEAAFLAALPKAPSRFAGQKTSPQTQARVHYVLDRMVEAGFVTPEAAADAKQQQLRFVDDDAPQPTLSGYVLDTAMAEVKSAVPDLPPDAVVTLTVDRDLQRRAEEALNATLSARSLKASEGAVVVMDRSGAIRAMVGGRDYAKSQFNRATQALRQPGSTFKTFVYAAALERGLTPTTVRNDQPVQLANWQPGNYEEEYRGPITLARALAISSNSVAVQVGSEVGPKQVADLARRFGIHSPLHAYPSIALGADEVTLLEMTAAYGVLANEGERTQPHIVAEVRNQRGEVLFANNNAAPVQVYSPEAARTLTGMLSNVVRYGTGVQAQVPGWEVAGKTGTSQSWRDAWFVGYSARMVAGVWIGNDDDRGTNKVTGGGAAAALFSKVMTAAHRGLEPEPLPGAELGPAWMDVDIPDGTLVDGEALPEGVSIAADDVLKSSPLSMFVAKASAPPSPAIQAPVEPAPAAQAVAATASNSGAPARKIAPRPESAPAVAPVSRQAEPGEGGPPQTAQSAPHGPALTEQIASDEDQAASDAP